jgi:hypothetical protein
VFWVGAEEGRPLWCRGTSVWGGPAGEWGGPALTSTSSGAARPTPPAWAPRIGPALPEPIPHPQRIDPALPEPIPHPQRELDLVRPCTQRRAHSWLRAGVVGPHLHRLPHLWLCGAFLLRPCNHKALGLWGTKEHQVAIVRLRRRPREGAAPPGPPLLRRPGAPGQGRPGRHPQPGPTRHCRAGVVSETVARRAALKPACEREPVVPPGMIARCGRARSHLPAKVCRSSGAAPAARGGPVARSSCGLSCFNRVSMYLVASSVEMAYEGALRSGEGGEEGDHVVIYIMGLDSATNANLLERPRHSAEGGIGASRSRIQCALGGLHRATRPHWGGLGQIVDPMTPNPKKTQRNARPNWIQSAPGARAAPGARTAAAAGQVAGGGRGAVCRGQRGQRCTAPPWRPSRPSEPRSDCSAQRPARCCAACTLLRGIGRDVCGREASSPPAARSPSPRPALRP